VTGGNWKVTCEVHRVKQPNSGQNVELTISSYQQVWFIKRHVTTNRTKNNEFFALGSV